MSRAQWEKYQVVPLGARSLDVSHYGGKSASLGKMIAGLTSQGVPVPGGFTTSATAYKHFLEYNELTWIYSKLEAVNAEDSMALSQVSHEIREAILAGSFSDSFVSAVKREVRRLRKAGTQSVAVRSSATAEDLPSASFAGQQETVLNVPTHAEEILLAIKRVIASLFGERAIKYRVDNNFSHRKVSLCVCVQRMIRSDVAVAGIAFSVDGETNHDGVIRIDAVHGLGETAVSGEVVPDRYILGKPYNGAPISILARNRGGQTEKLVYALADQLAENPGQYTVMVPTTSEERKRFCLSSADLITLGRHVLSIEKFYGRPMDIEWAKDGPTGKIHIVQARPVTTINHGAGKEVEIYHVGAGEEIVLAEGLAVGSRAAGGRVVILKDASPEELARVQPGDVLVARMTNPDYCSAMKRAAAVITEEGGPNCHAAIVARESRTPTIVACQGILAKLKEGQIVTVSCAGGEIGRVYQGQLPIKVERIKIGKLPHLPTAVKMIIGDPHEALLYSRFPNQGVGLVRQEFVIQNAVGIHPQALLDYDKIKAEVATAQQVGAMTPEVFRLEKLISDIDERIAGYDSPVDFYVSKLAEGLGLIARAFAPHRIVVRLSDFKTNEYSGLIGGFLYEKEEANPMIGFRGAMRYLDPSFEQAFRLECSALKRVRKDMGLTNVDIMVPFIRTIDEGLAVKRLLARNGLKSVPGENGLAVGMMCEVPSNVVLATDFAAIFDFCSIGSNDLTQLVLGQDRDSGRRFNGDVRDQAVMDMIEQTIDVWRDMGKPVGICGQAPSDYPEVAVQLMKWGITSMSLNPDSVVKVWKRLGRSIPSNKMVGV